MNRDEFIDHELRIKMLEIVNKQTLYRLNALITIAVTGFAMPMLIKYFGGQ